MKIMFACLADHASADQISNKLSVAGIFDKISAPQFPARVARAFLVFRLMFEYEDGNKTHTLSIVLRDADHRQSAKLDMTMDAGPVAPGTFVTVNSIFEMLDTVFTRPGRYTFALATKEGDEITIPLDLVQVGHAGGQP